MDNTIKAPRINVSTYTPNVTKSATPFPPETYRPGLANTKSRIAIDGNRDASDTTESISQFLKRTKYFLSRTAQLQVFPCCDD